ncbi:MAG: SDR family NAD(P)-dependent oxidoreductase [Alphaproteobacteria bacterium]
MNYCRSSILQSNERREAEYALERQVAIVTGAASGLGAATAKMFADGGVKVITADRATEKCAIVADEIVADGGEALFLKL